MNGLALDSGEFIPADELNARWLPRKATEEEMGEEQPEAMRLEEKWRAVSAQQAEEISRLHAENEALREQIGQGVLALLEQIANEPPINGNAMAQARILMKVAKLRASAHPAPQANKTHVLVPLRMTRAMQDVVSEEDWSWAELLAAAEAVTEEEFTAAEQAEPIMPQAAVVQQKPLTDEQIRRIELTVHGYTRQPLDVKAFARAIEAAATEPLLQHITELERQLKEARNQALEEAAKVCDVTPPQPFRPSIEAAHAIRALKGAKE